MTASSGLRARPDGDGGKPAETALSWAACCVLPMSLALAGLGLGSFGWIAGQRTWITFAALGVVGVGWVLTWRRARMCRTDAACRAPSRLGTAMLGVATALCLLALTWQPIVEPWALSLIRSARG